MRISVVTASYNSYASIAETLASVAQQTHADVEHIIIDGGSTDGTLDVIREQGSRVARVVSEPDDGIYDAMNKGVSLATGDVIAFLNADDKYADPDVLARIAANMADEPVDAVFGDIEFFRLHRPQAAVRRYRSRRFRPDRIAWGWMPAHPALFVRKRVFETVGPFSTHYRIAGDFEWIARAFYASSIRYRYIPKVLVHMRTGGVSTGGWRNTILLNREVMRACRENRIRTNWLKILSKYPAKILEFVRA